MAKDTWSFSTEKSNGDDHAVNRTLLLKLREKLFASIKIQETIGSCFSQCRENLPHLGRLSDFFVLNYHFRGTLS